MGEPSPRAQAAEQIAQFILDNDLCHIYGGESELSGDKRYRSIGFSRRANLDGHVRVYSPTFILVFWLTRYQTVEPEGSRKFRSSEHAIAFLCDAFVFSEVG